PAAASTATPAVASWFITTRAHSPPRGVQVSVWVPEPAVAVTQKPCSAGGSMAVSPGTNSVLASNGQYRTSTTRSYAVPASHCSTWSRGPIPTNTGPWSAAVTRTWSWSTGPARQVPRSAAPTNATVEVSNRATGVV